ncbi:MAG: hypothetical protein ACK4IX_11645, partial [Candidatus Sericytochromatia bacterium]
FQTLFFELLKIHNENIQSLKLPTSILNVLVADNDESIEYVYGEEALFKFFCSKHFEFEEKKKKYSNKSIDVIMKEVFFSRLRTELTNSLALIKDILEYIDSNKEINNRNKVQFYRHVFNTQLSEYQSFWFCVIFVSIATSEELKKFKKLKIHNKFRIIKINKEITEYLYSRIENS